MTTELFEAQVQFLCNERWLWLLNGLDEEGFRKTQDSALHWVRENREHAGLLTDPTV